MAASLEPLLQIVVVLAGHCCSQLCMRSQRRQHEGWAVGGMGSKCLGKGEGRWEVDIIGEVVVETGEQ